METLEAKDELTPEDYDLMLELEKQKGEMPLANFLVDAYEKAFPPS